MQEYLRTFVQSRTSVLVWSAMSVVELFVAVVAFSKGNFSEALLSVFQAFLFYWIMNLEGALSTRNLEAKDD